MKKVLLAGTALLGVAMISAPASAEVNLDLGGYFRGYGVFVDHDEDYGGAVGGGASADLREFDFRRDTEIHFSGETTTDNGLTLGFHYELAMGQDGTVFNDLNGNGTVEAGELTTSGNTTDEAYMYISSGMGRINFGSEDGAAYLLQVSAPSADSNVDGLRTYISGVGGLLGGDDWNYQNAAFENTDRLTYMTPKWNGFQAGVSYAPESGQNAVGNNVAAMTTDDDNDEFEDLWEASARWDGEFEGFGISLGAGYSDASLENNAGTYSDDFNSWNLGANVAFNGFSVGAAYRDTEVGADLTSIGLLNDDVERDTWVVGAAYDNGPYHLGVSYLETQYEQAGLVGEIEGDRWTFGAGYTYGPGATFRGTISSFSEDLTDAGGSDEDALQVTIGTDVQF